MNVRRADASFLGGLARVQASSYRYSGSVYRVFTSGP